MTHLSQEDADYVRQKFSSLTNDVRLIFFRSARECEYCNDASEILTQISGLSERIHLEILDLDTEAGAERARAYGVTRAPAIVVEGEKDYGIRLYGVPAGYEFASLFEDIRMVGNRDSGLAKETREALLDLKEPVHIQVFVTLTCPHCPRAVSVAHRMAMESDLVTASMVEASEFTDLAAQYDVYAVPKIIMNETVQFEGALGEKVFLENVMKAAAKQS